MRERVDSVLQEVDQKVGPNSDNVGHLIFLFMLKDCGVRFVDTDRVQRRFTLQLRAVFCDLNDDLILHIFRMMNSTDVVAFLLACNSHRRSLLVKSFRQGSRFEIGPRTCLSFEGCEQTRELVIFGGILIEWLHRATYDPTRYYITIHEDSDDLFALVNHLHVTKRWHEGRSRTVESWKRICTMS